MEFDTASFGFQGDAEAPQLLERLARRNPYVEWVIVGKNDRHTDHLPPNVTNPWPSDPWFRNGPVQHVSSIKPERMHLMTPLPPGNSYVVNDTRSFDFESAISQVIGELDGMIVHVGQHGTSSGPIPKVGSTWAEYRADPDRHATNPQAWSRNYERFLVDGLNILGDRTGGRAPVVWLVTDPRNYVKTRSIKWPTGLDDILAQYRFTRTQRHERFVDLTPPDRWDGWSGTPITSDRGGELWRVTHTYRYGGLELMILPDDWEEWGPSGFHARQYAGIATTSFNDGRIGKEPRRSELVRDYLLPAFPNAEVFGKWDDVSITDVPDGTVVRNKPGEFTSLLDRWRVTLSLPALGSSWTVAKPMQTFAARVVTFFVGRLDDQGWLLPSRRATSGTSPVGEVDGVVLHSVRDDWTDVDLKLARWLRVETPDEFAYRGRLAAENFDVWTSLVHAQLDLLRRRWDEHLVENEIENKLGIK